MVDREALASALREIGTSIVADARKRATAADATASSTGRAGSNAHKQLILDGILAAYREGLESMSSKIRDYAGAVAPTFSKQFEDAANKAIEQILEDRLGRFRASSVFKPAQSEEIAHMAGIEDALRAAKTGAIRDHQNKVQQPEDALPWWQRHMKETLLVLLGAIAGAVATKLLGN